MKNVTRNKFLLCFRPVVMEVDGVDCSNGKVFTYISVENKEDLKISTMETSSLAGKDCSAMISEEIVRRPDPKRSFSQIVKAVLFPISLSKRARDRKVRQDSYRSKSSNHWTRSSILSSLSSSSSSSSSSSASSSSTCSISEPNTPSSLRSNCINQKQSLDHKNMKRTNIMGWSSFNSGLYLLLISLTVTIFWGRICAILFTSIWLYFLSSRQFCVGRPVNGIRSPEIMESRDYKKRVIMEGLLERNRHKGQH